MSSDRKEAFRQWAAISVSALALLISVLRGPMSLALRSTVEDVLRQELGRQQTSADADVRTRQSRQIGETLSRLDAELAALRTNGPPQKQLMEIGASLLRLQSRLDSLEKDVLKERAVQKPQSSHEIE